MHTKKNKNNTAGGGKSKLLLLAALAFLAVIILLWNNGCARQTPAPTPTTTTQAPATTVINEETNKTQAITIVKETKDMSAKLEEYKTKREKDKVKVELIPNQEYTAKPSEGKEAGKFYDVTYEWKEDGKAVPFVWQVDIQTKEVTPVSDAAKAVEETTAGAAAVEPITKDTPPPLAITPEVVPTEQPGSFVKPPTPEVPPTGKPGNTGAIDILPPPTKTGPGGQAAAPIKIGETQNYEITGIMKSGKSNRAMLQKDGKVFDAAVGTKLPGGWVVEKVTEKSVTMKKGSQSKTLQMGAGIPAPGSVPKAGTYPKAIPGGAKKAPADDKTTDENDEAPPPPEPGQKAPAGAPTVIPTR